MATLENAVQWMGQLSSKHYIAISCDQIEKGCKPQRKAHIRMDYKYNHVLMPPLLMGVQECDRATAGGATGDAEGRHGARAQLRVSQPPASVARAVRTDAIRAAPDACDPAEAPAADPLASPGSRLHRDTCSRCGAQTRSQYYHPTTSPYLWCSTDQTEMLPHGCIGIYSVQKDKARRLGAREGMLPV